MKGGTVQVIISWKKPKTKRAKFSGYCTCLAGKMEKCAHLAIVLFSIFEKQGRLVRSTNRAKNASKITRKRHEELVEVMKKTPKIPRKRKANNENHDEKEEKEEEKQQENY